MSKLFLRAKHWQIFLLTYGIPLILQIVMMASVFLSMFNLDKPADPSAFFDYMALFPIIMLFFCVFFFGWFWSAGVGVHKKLPENIKMNVTLFKILLLFSVTYLCVFLFYFTGLMNSFMIYPMSTSPGFESNFIQIILPLHLLFMFCMFYMMYFVAKVIKAVEEQRKVSFSDFAGEFFMLWFFPVGIWIIQPRINKIMGQAEEGFVV